jgi:hypothetical protein
VKSFLDSQKSNDEYYDESEFIEPQISTNEEKQIEE